MISEIQQHRVSLFRINDLGDFFSAEYIQKWRRIVHSCRAIRFFAYTRSWRCPALWPALQQLAAEPNMNLILSLDRDCFAELAKLPGGANYRTAWLAVDDDDRPPFPVSVVFRNEWRDLPALTDLNHFGSPVCPAEINVATKITCRQCRRCINAAG